jgi:hypothetical protein
MHEKESEKRTWESSVDAWRAAFLNDYITVSKKRVMCRCLGVTET